MQDAHSEASMQTGGTTVVLKQHFRHSPSTAVAKVHKNLLAFNGTKKAEKQVMPSLP
jgi:hypothetical protein